jgi:hypothetical protein
VSLSKLTKIAGDFGVGPSHGVGLNPWRNLPEAVPVYKALPGTDRHQTRRYCLQRLQVGTSGRRETRERVDDLGVESPESRQELEPDPVSLEVQ